MGLRAVPYSFVPSLGKGRRLLRGTSALSAFALMGSLLAGTPVMADTSAPPVKAASGKPVAERPDRVSALLTARLQKSRVLIASDTTESTLAYANPDQTVTVESVPGVARVQKDGKWVPVDTDLIEVDGYLKPKAAMEQAGVEFSAGGEGRPLAKMTRADGQTFALEWPTALPRPTIQGNVATYADAAGLPGADLVVTALAAGFRHDVVLRERPSGPVEFRIPVRTEGLKLGMTKSGGLKLADDKGKTVAEAPEPFMYDSPAQGAQAADGVQHSEIATSVVSDHGRQALVLKPDPAFLADPHTTYPVTVDPTMTLPVSKNATVYSGPGSFFPSNRLDVGNQDVYNSSSNRIRTFSRALLGFDTSSLVGKKITDAKLELWSPGGEVRPTAYPPPTPTPVVTCQYAAWARGRYSPGDRVSYNSKHWQALTEIYPDSTVAPGADLGVLWKSLGACPTTTPTPETPSVTPGNWGCLPQVAIKVQRVTASWTQSVGWGNQPATTSAGEQTITDPTGCSSGSYPTQGARWVWPVTDIAQAWADGAAGNGVTLRLATESTTVDNQPFERLFHSSTYNAADARPPMLSVTYALPPEMGTLVAWPSVTLPDSRVVVTSVTPELQARLTDTATVPQRVEFELEHDPTTPSQGTGLIWSGAVDSVPANAPALVKVPQGLLREGWNVRWRARASDGVVYSAWSVWRSFALDTTVASPAVTCADYPAGQWSAKKPGAVTCVLNNGTGKALPYTWGLDDPATSTQGSGGGSGGVSNISISPDDGWHILYVKVGNNSVSSYGFGVGQGGMTKPEAGVRTERAVALAAHAASTWTSVRYEYRTDLTSTGPWAAIPSAQVTRPGETAPLAAWPVARSDTGKPFAELSWDLAATLRAAGRADGPVQIRPCFANGTTESCTSPRLIVYGGAGFAAPRALADFEAGKVSVLTGDLTVSATDGSLSGLGVDRTHTTLLPYDEQGSLGVFGPGWSAAFASGGGMSAYRLEDHTSEGYVLLIGPGRITLVYAIDSSGTYAGVGEDADGSKIIKTSATEFKHVSRNDATTRWTKDAQGRWTVNKVTRPADESEVGYVRDSQGRYTRLLAPVPSGVTCASSLVKGCKALDITYATATTATGIAAGWGDFTGQVKRLSYVAFDPDSNAMKTTVVTTYAYDSTGHLRQVTDALAGTSTTYYYNGQGRLSQISPPGVEPWRLDYDLTGRFAHIARTTPQGESVQAVVYGVPITGTGAPVDLSATETAKWGQITDLPRVGAALFPASHVPPRGGDGSYAPGAGDWSHASLTYLDVAGRPVNSVGYGGGGWQIASTRYDERGLVTWSLSPGNRQRALSPDWTVVPFVAAQQDTAARANLLATTSTYDEQGDLRNVTGPAREVSLSDGRTVPARSRSSYLYDEGKPTSGVDEFGTPYQDKNWHLLTSFRAEPLVLDGDTSVPSGDVQLTKAGYDPIDAGSASGWKLRASTTGTVTKGANSGDLTKRVRYDSAGRIVESRTPASNGNDPGTTVITYYGAGANATYPQCGNRPEWAGMVCREAPKQQASGQPLPVTETTAYNYFGLPPSQKQTAGSVTRTSAFTYDGAGRVRTLKLTVTPEAAGGTPVGERTVTYDPQNGLPKTISADGITLSSEYDTLGREVATTDATGNIATTTYDLDGHVVSVNDGKGVSSYTYDGTDARGQAEHRGLVTGIQTTTGTFRAGYGPDGELNLQSFPNNLWRSSVHDTTGRQIRLSYGMDRTTWQPWLQWEEQANASSQTTQTATPQSLNRYSYDRLGQLTKVEDSYDLVNCATRVYAFDDSSNRTRLDSYAPAADGSCTTGTTPVSESYTYDNANRITNSGYSYDALGRTTTVPAAHVAGGAEVTVGYYADDRVRSLVQGSLSKSFALDPAGRIVSTTTSGGSPGTVTNHYADGGDSPAWVTETDGSWTRYIGGFDGMSAVQKSGGEIKLQLTNPHGDIVATLDNDPAAVGVDSYSEYTEYGSARSPASAPSRYGWLGAGQRSSDALGGLVLMGTRLYNPVTARFTQVDPMEGSCNSYEAGCGDPVSSDGPEDGQGTVTTGINPREIWDCNWEIGALKCTKMFAMKLRVENFVHSRLDEHSRGGNAVRHFVGIVLLMFYFGIDDTRTLADIHERYVSDKDKKDSAFDKEINKIAEKWYKEHKGDLATVCWENRGPGHCEGALADYIYWQAVFLLCGQTIGGVKVDCKEAKSIAVAPKGDTHHWW
ncbi:hypothetical protein OG589_42645 [Sphaerisporangium sp. NBC_01403]|uniref:hypothetical protein n=1 Tax=Sphaerisporangium sp. NBC_01403 TaxID=2903599 RepID=UPI00324BDD97